MARKKPRQPQSNNSATGTTAPAAPRPAAAVNPTAITSNTNGTAPKTAITATAPQPQPQADKKGKERTMVEIWTIRISRTCGSLQAAVVLLILFALAVLLGTLMESWYSAKIAQELVYKAWWFVLLLGLLSVNIFFAAAKKWPWKWHQTGFVVTHIGLLILLSGGILNGLSGVDALMQLLDTSDGGRSAAGRPGSGPPAAAK